MKLHRDLGISQKAAWLLAHKIRETWNNQQPPFSGPVEVDETYIGGKERNKHAKDRLNSGRGPVGKTAVVGAKNHMTKKINAAVVERTNMEALQGFVHSMVEDGAIIYIDDHRAYQGLSNRQAVKHSMGEYVRDQAHTNGVESFWSMLKRGYYGTYHKMSSKRLDRYVIEFAGRQNDRSLDTMEQMQEMVRGTDGKRLRYRDLVS